MYSAFRARVLAVTVTFSMLNAISLNVPPAGDVVVPRASPDAVVKAEPVVTVEANTFWLPRAVLAARERAV